MLTAARMGVFENTKLSLYFHENWQNVMIKIGWVLFSKIKKKQATKNKTYWTNKTA